MTKHERIVLSAYTGTLMCEFHDMHVYIEKKMGHPVWTHKFGNEVFMAKVKEACREDFLALLEYEEEVQG